MFPFSSRSGNLETFDEMTQRYTIGEVSQLLGVKQHVIRYWEEEVPLLAPKKSKSGRRVYTDRELQLLLRLKHLLYEKRYTIEGARERIWKETSSSKADLTARIAAVRSDLLSVWEKIKGKEDR
jgi:DNA-binding transcriptional MerR regulator